MIDHIQGGCEWRLSSSLLSAVSCPSLLKHCQNRFDVPHSEFGSEFDHPWLPFCCCLASSYLSINERRAHDKGQVDLHHGTAPGRHPELLAHIFVLRFSTLSTGSLAARPSAYLMHKIFQMASDWS